MEIFPILSDTDELIGNIAFWILLGVQFFWLLFFYLRIVVYKDKKQDVLLPVSVIIAAKNEEDNLQKYLPSILEQDYPEFEVIVINHDSKDNTIYVLKDFEKKYKNLRIIDLQNSSHLMYGKKLPITLGVKGAKYEHLLFTDADCQPVSSKWIEEMSNKFTDKKEIVLGYAPYVKKKGWLNRIIRLDTTFIALNYLSYAKGGLPYMGVGRNLAYTKDLFMTIGGFKSHYSIISGDDDLFIQEAAKHRNYTISLAPSSFNYSEPKESWERWRMQKARHFTTSKRYSHFKKIMLGIYPLTLLLGYATFIMLIFNNWMNWFGLGLFLLLIITKWIILGLAFKRLEQKLLGWGVLFWDVVYALLTPFIYYTSDKSRKQKWK